MITLDKIELPNDLSWPDEMDWSPVEESKDYSIEGALIIDAGTKQAGRPITLTGSETTCWILKSVLTKIKALEATPGKEMTLVYGVLTFNVKFDLSSGPAVVATPIIEHNEFIGASNYYNNLIIKLLVI